MRAAVAIRVRGSNVATRLMRPQIMNQYEHPVREGQPDCSFYMKTGQCKFGPACKFNHPPIPGGAKPAPAGIGAMPVGMAAPF